MQKAKAVNFLAALAFFVSGYFIFSLAASYLSRFTSVVTLIAAVKAKGSDSIENQV